MSGEEADAGTITVCQCNIFDGGKWTEQDQSVVTYNTADRFAQFVASVNPPGSTHPPIAVIGMQELMSETDRLTIEGYLETYTGVAWNSARTAQGINGTSGIGMFWRPDLVELRPEWELGNVVVEQIDNGYVVRFVGRLFRKVGTDDAFGFITGKLVWGDAILNGHAITEEERRQEAIRLKTWILQGDSTYPGMSGFPGTSRVIATDLNTDTGTSTWDEMNLEFSDPSSQHTHNSFSGTTVMDWFGKRLDYVWWDYDAYGKRSGGFASVPTRSGHVGSDHRSVYATVELHAVDLTPPAVVVTSPVAGSVVDGTVPVSADASDDSGILQVQFLVDGSSVWTDTVAPHEFSWNTAGYAEGYHTITAVATDASSNRLRKTSAPVVVWVGPPGSAPTIADAKLTPNNSAVAVSGKIVTAAFADGFYIEEPDRSAGIKVTNVPSPAVASVVAVVGVMRTTNNERQISGTDLSVLGNAPVPDPLGMRNAWVGGGPFGDYTPGIYGSTDAHNIGLLVRSWGKVTGVVGSYYVYIDDGAGLRDGYGYTGVRVDTSGLIGWSAPAVGKYVEVTGVSTTSLINGKTQRRIKVRSAADVKVVH